MPRLDDRFLDCSIYLYPTEATVREGMASGGAGFLAAVPAANNWLIDGTCPQRDFHHLYAVSNRHVAEKNPIVRLNTHDGTVDIIQIERADWIMGTTDDLAICPLTYQRAYRFISINIEDFLTKEIARRNDIGIGDEVFMLGRFISHEGQQRNVPAVRWGHVSMMPFEPVFHPTNKSGQQESFLVEIHSISGFSGSPVFVRPVSSPKIQLRHTATNTAVSNMFYHSTEGVRGGPWLLGVDWGYINKHDQHQNNSGMSAVVPAWCLRALLMNDAVVEMRKSEQIDLKARHDRGGTSLAGK